MHRSLTRSSQNNVSDKLICGEDFVSTIVINDQWSMGARRPLVIPTRRKPERSLPSLATTRTAPKAPIRLPISAG
jgi:hypothetical protein